mmetsp:Transcript_6581/g.7640  ORF Transcript_6581/g.7640 Transcript_6581/m.7640 type:complete len:889 (-) Transcript_6581:449-3115(-)
MSRRQPRKMNPAFLRKNREMSNTTTNNDFRLENIIKRARDNGKLLASNIGLKYPLPEEFFIFPFNESRYTEELLTVVDFSDNGNFLKDTEIDARVLRYRSVRSLRFRNCGLKISPISSDTINNNNNLFSFRTLENLTILDLSGNQLESFDIGLMILSGKSSSLVELNLSNNRIREVVATTAVGNNDNDEYNNDVIALPRLRSFDVSHNTPLESLFENKNKNENTNNKQLSCNNLRIFRCHHNPNFRSSSTTTPPTKTKQKTDGLPSFLRSTTGTLEVIEASHNPKMVTGAGKRIDLSDYVQLQTVTFVMNKLDTVPCIPPSLKRIDLRSNKIASISGLFPLTSEISTTIASSLVDLILSDNYLTHLDPLVVERMGRLQRLDLASNKLTSLPYQLGFLTDIKNISMAGNPVVTKFSFSVVTETNDNHNPQPLLKLLRDRAPTDKETSTEKFNEVISNDDNTVVSDLLSNALSTKGNNTLDLAGKITASSLNNENSVVILEAFIQELRSKPSIARGVTGQLILDSNFLKSIPEDLLLHCLPNVQVISFNANCLTELPSFLRTSSSATVKKLQLRKNKLTTESLVRVMWFQPTASISSNDYWSLQSLTHLDLSSNRLSSFPIDTSSNLLCFPLLQVMNLSNNRINTVNDWNRLPSSLMILDLSENIIEDIEPLVTLLSAYCPQFQRLSLIHNHIKRIPLSLGLLHDYAPRIVSVKMLGNPQRAIRNSILERPCFELLSYLVNRLTVAQRQSATGKIQELQEQIRQEKEVVENDRIQPVVSASKLQHREESSKTIASIDENEKEHQCQQKDGSFFSNNDNNNVDIDVDVNDNDNKVMDEFKTKIAELKAQLENLSLTQAKKYALKKSLAMERSKLIREERRLLLQKTSDSSI